MSAISSVHKPCGKTLRGTKVEHCTVCCETFGTTLAGDMHRKGEYPDRYCVDPATIGLHLDAGGVWRLPGSFRPGTPNGPRREDGGRFTDLREGL